MKTKKGNKVSAKMRWFSFLVGFLFLDMLLGGLTGTTPSAESQTVKERLERARQQDEANEREGVMFEANDAPSDHNDSSKDACPYSFQDAIVHRSEEIAALIEQEKAERQPLLDEANQIARDKDSSFHRLSKEVITKEHPDVFVLQDPKAQEELNADRDRMVDLNRRSQDIGRKYEKMIDAVNVKYAACFE